MADLLIAANSVPLSGADLVPSSGTPQYATSGNPVTAIPATVWPAYMANCLMSELTNIVVAAGMTPSGAAWDQVWQAILANGSFIDTGTANNIIVAPPSPLVVEALHTGQVITVAPAVANTGATTLNFGGITKNVTVGGGITPANSIVPGIPAVFLYGGTEWYLQNPAVTPAFLGGTGNFGMAVGDVPIANGVNPFTGAAPGAAGTALISNGTGVAPSFQYPSIGVGEITGILPVPNGGTGLGNLGLHYLLVGNGTSNINGVGPGTAGEVLISNGAADPSFQPVTNAIGILGVPNGGTGVGNLNQWTVLIGNGTGNISGAAPGTAGYALVSTGPTSNPQFDPLNLNIATSGKLPINAAPVQLQVSVGIAGTYSFTVPADTFALFGQCTGGGGGGAGIGASFNGGGGGSGGFSFTWFAVSPGDVISYTIGAGGAGGAAGADGSNGGSSSIGSFMSASGGLAGASTANGSGGGPGTSFVPGPPGADLNGGMGGDGSQTTSPGLGNGGNGGSSFWGGGQRASTVTLGTNCAPGVGGGGGYGAGASGGSGMPGLINIWG